MMKAVRVHAAGGRHRVEVEEVELARPGLYEVEIRHTAIGLNYPDIQDCKGGPHFNKYDHHAGVFIPGCSAVGVITELGPGVLNHKIGERVGYVHTPSKGGAFREAIILPTSYLIPLPSTISDEDAAALLFPGLTSWMLFKKLRPLNSRVLVFVHGAGTGLGTILTQFANHLNAIVIGTVDDEDDFKLAEGRGCDSVIDLSDGADDYGEYVWEMSNCEGVEVIVDLVGLSDFDEVLNLLAPKGMLVCLTNKAPVLTFKELADYKSVIVAVPVLADYVTDQAELAEGVQYIFDLYNTGAIKVEIAKKIPLNMINEALDAPGLCILIPPIPDPKCVPEGS